MPKLEQTTGVVLRATIGSGQSRYRAQSGGYHYRTSYFPDITYQYTVDGQSYTHDAYARRRSLINRQSIVQRILKNYPVNARVPVYYDPSNPQEAYLQKGYGGAVNAILLAVLAVVLVVAAVILVLAL